MKDMLTIVIRLTVSCLMAATVMGLCFIFTSNAKKHNEHVKEQQVMYELLGYKDGAKVPESLALNEVYRYVISSDQQSIAYLVPNEGAEAGYSLVNIDLNGALIEKKPIALSETEILETETRNKAVQQAVGPGYVANFADRVIIVTDNGKRIAYLIGGKFQGFKTFVHVMLAVDTDFTLVGLEILEHEEDPGLGAEIEQDYFKNQFKGKPLEAIKTVDVVKAPLPQDYYMALTGKLDAEDILKFREQYKDKDIYALTGATISTKAVSNGVKGIVMKFAYRINVLDKVLKEQHLAVSF